MGFIALGPRTSGHIYTDEDYRVLDGAARELAIRLDQAKSYELQQGEIHTLTETISKRDEALENAESRLQHLHRAFSFDLLDVLMVADSAPLAQPGRDFLGEYFDVEVDTEIKAHPGKHFAAIVVLISYADSEILRNLKKLKFHYPDTPIIGLFGEGRHTDVRHGQFPEIDLLLEGKENVPEVVYRLYRVRHSAPIAQSEVIIFKHKNIGDIVTVVRERAGASGNTVLLTGEKGVGKTTIAKLIHHWSGDRAEGPFVRVELRKCDPKALPKILFGLDGTPGKFVEAAGGTLFLDDVDALPYTVQTQLLEVVTQKELPPESGMSDHKLDVRLIASTPSTMDEERSAGRFREDLYYRLSVERFDILPLRERREDVKLLLSAFLDNYNRQNRTNILMPKTSQLVLFENYRWPNNVTEMERRVYRAASFLSAGDNLVFEDRVAEEEHESEEENVVPLAEAVANAKRATVQQAIAIAKGNMGTAASMLGVSAEELTQTLKDLR